MDIPASTMITAAAVALLSYSVAVIFKPLILITRDLLVWWMIEKYINRKKYQSKASRLAIMKAEFNYREMTKPLTLDKKTGAHYEGSQKIQKDEYLKKKQERASDSLKINKLDTEIINAIANINSILKHYSQEIKNPLHQYVQDKEKYHFQKLGLEYTTSNKNE